MDDARVLDTLRFMGVDYGQGYYIGKPTPFSEYMKKYAANK
ncbi:hypothetical protein N752_22255 [Desulforamulus aquiferis]|nr:hypothetical protein N752_22255 [Desulforamulus aquiferis]